MDNQAIGKVASLEKRERVSKAAEVECRPPIPGIDRLWDYSDIIISVIMAASMLAIGLILNGMFYR